MQKIPPFLCVCGCLASLALLVTGCQRAEVSAAAIPVKTTHVSAVADDATQIYSGAFIPRMHVDLAFSVGG